MSRKLKHLYIEDSQDLLVVRLLCIFDISNLLIWEYLRALARD